MVELILPKNSPADQGQDLAEAGGHPAARISRLSLRSGQRGQSAHRHLLRRSRRLRADGARRAAVDQEQDRPDADAAPLLPRGHLRLVLDEHRRLQHARLHQGDGRDQGRDPDLSAAAHAGDQGSGARPFDLLRAAPLDRAVAEDDDAGAGDRMAAERSPSASGSTGSTSASCAPAARPRARPIGGTARNISARPSCCRPIAG